GGGRRPQRNGLDQAIHETGPSLARRTRSRVHTFLRRNVHRPRPGLSSLSLTDIRKSTKGPIGATAAVGQEVRHAPLAACPLTSARSGLIIGASPGHPL